VTIHRSPDRLEGDRKQTAVPLADHGTPINFPKALLPKGARPGDVLTLRIEGPTEAAQREDDIIVGVAGQGRTRYPREVPPTDSPESDLPLSAAARIKYMITLKLLGSLIMAGVAGGHAGPFTFDA
jgi:hypothetical protein